MTGMRVLLVERNNGRRLYEVHEHFSKRWWTASHDFIVDNWYVCNSRGTPLRDFGRTWLKVVAACEAFAKERGF